MSRTTLLLRLAVLLLMLGLVVTSLSPVSASPVKLQAGPCPPGVHAIPTSPITPQDVITYVTTHPLPRNVNSQAVIDDATVRYKFASYETVRQQWVPRDDNGCPSGTQIAYVEFQAKTTGSSTPRPNFEFPGPNGSVGYPIGFEVFVVATGNLLVSGGRTQPVPGLTPAPQSK